MAVAIFTKFLPVTNTKGARVKAYTAWSPGTQRQVTLDWHSIDASDQKDKHKAAVSALLTKLGWEGVWHRGDAGDSHYVFVKASDERYLYGDKFRIQG